MENNNLKFSLPAYFTCFGKLRENKRVKHGKNPEMVSLKGIFRQETQFH